MSMFHELMMKKKGMPSRYQEVEYIENTGTQYIDTGYVPNPNTEIETKLKVVEWATSSYGGVFGSRTSNHSADSFILCREGSNNNCRLEIDTNHYTIITNMNEGVDCLIKITATKFNCNGIDFNIDMSAIVPNGKNLYLFGTNENNHLETVYGSCHIRQYPFKISENGAIKRNFIPVYDTETQKYGMWESVQGKFYGNAGTGDFKGSIVGYTVVGSPTIVDGVVSGFSSANYLRAPDLPNYTKLERFVKFNTGTTTTNTRTIIGSSPYGSINLEATTNKIRTTIFVSPTYATMTLNTALLENTTYYYRDILENGTVKGYLYDSNMNLIEEKSSALGYDTGRYFIIGKTTNSERPFTNGSVYLNETYVKVDNKLWFNGQQA